MEGQSWQTFSYRNVQKWRASNHHLQPISTYILQGNEIHYHFLYKISWISHFIFFTKTLNNLKFESLLFFVFVSSCSGQIRNAVNGNNSNSHVNYEGRKVVTASSSGSSRTGSRSNSATRRSTQNGNDGPCE